MVFGKLESAKHLKHHRVLLSNIRCKYINMLRTHEHSDSIEIRSFNDETTISVYIQIATRKVTLLVDTGSSVSLLNANVLKKNIHLAKNKKIELTSATGHNALTLGLCSSKIKLSNYIITHDFHIYDNIAIPVKYDGIIGFDFLKEFNCVLDFDKNVLSFKINKKQFEYVKSTKNNINTAQNEVINAEYENKKLAETHALNATAEKNNSIIKNDEQCSYEKHKEKNNIETETSVNLNETNAIYFEIKNEIYQSYITNKNSFSFPEKNFDTKIYAYQMFSNTKMYQYLRNLNLLNNKNDSHFIIPENCSKNIQLHLPLPNGTYLFNKQNILPFVSIPNCLINILNEKTTVLIINENKFPLVIQKSMFSNPQIENISNFNIFLINENKTDRQHFIENSLILEECDENLRAKIVSLCTNYNECFFIPGDTVTHTDVITHSIELKPNSSPKFIKQYKIPQSQKAELKRQLDELEQQKIIEKCQASGWNSPIFLVPKADSNGQKTKLRLVVDFQHLNQNTVPIQFPIPNIDTILNQLANSKYFSTLDLYGAFYQIKLEKNSRPLTTFENNSFSYRFVSMPQGLCTSPATMQNAVNLLLDDLLNKGVNVYFDDILIYSNTVDSHLVLLEEVFIRLKKHNLKLKIEKCRFLRKEICYLGYIINENGCLPNPTKVECVQNYPVPKNTTETQRFLGLANYYRKFIKNYANLAKPLYDLLKKDQSFNWNTECTNAFNSLKSALISPPVLIFPNFEKTFIVTTDASNYAIGAVLSQGDLPNDQPIEFASKVLNDAQKKYSTIEKELLAIVYAVNIFKHYIYGYEFILYTDHRPLVYLFNFKNPSSRLHRWKLALSEYNFKIIYRRGTQNTVADALSRIDNYEPVELNGLLSEEAQVRAITRSKTSLQQNSIQPNSPEVYSSRKEAQNFFNLTEHKDILINHQTVDHIFFLFESPKCELKRKVEYRMKSNLVLPPDLVNFSPYKLNDHITIYIAPDQKREEERVLKFKTLQNSILQICNSFNYNEIAINLDIKNPKYYFEFKFLFKEIFKSTNIIVKFYLSKIIEITELDHILDILNSYHNSSLSGHSSYEKTKNSIIQYYHWPTINKDIKQFVSNCEICKKSKITKHTKSPMMITSTSDHPFQKIYIDFVNVERQHTNTYPHIFTCIDELTKYAVAVRAKNSTAELAAKKLVKHVILKYNIPDAIVSDQGSAFLSNTFKEITKLFKIKKITTTAYRPNSNIVERFHRTLAQHLISCVHLNPSAWHEHLDSAVFAYNNTVNSSTGYSPHELIFGYRIQLPDTILKCNNPIYTYENYKDDLRQTLKSYWQNAKTSIEHRKTQNKAYRDQNANPIQVKIGDQVYLRKPIKDHKFSTPYDSPFTVEDIVSPVNIKIKKGNKSVVIHTDKIKPIRNAN